MDITGHYGSAAPTASFALTSPLLITSLFERLATVILFQYILGGLSTSTFERYKPS
jgi:hypothetical protein